MKKKLSFTLFWLFAGTMLMAQSNAVRLDPGAQVTNTIIFNNANSAPLPAGVNVNHSASDSTLSGTNNIMLLSSPFSSIYGGFGISFGSAVFNTGLRSVLRMQDTLDLANKPRVSCDFVDIGAYEYDIPATKITLQPLNRHACEGEGVFFQTAADGVALSYQWQVSKDSVVWTDIVRTPLENLTGNLVMNTISLSDTGWYRAIAIGHCCNDTTVAVRLNIDEMSRVVAMNDTTVYSTSTINLYVTGQNGTIYWTENDGVTTLLSTTTPPLTENAQYFVFAKNGVCPEVSDQVTITVFGDPCNVKTRPDTAVCVGTRIFLTLENTTHWYQWFQIDGTTPMAAENRIPAATINSDIKFIVKGQNELGTTCEDTLIVQVQQIPSFVARTDTSIVQGTQVLLYSTPDATRWFVFGNDTEDLISLTVAPLVTTEYVAELQTLLCGSIFDTVTITVTVSDELTVSIRDIIEATNEECTGASALIDITGGTQPYDFEWYKGSELFSIGQNLNNVQAGVYNLIVIDAEGCQRELEARIGCHFKRVMPTLFITPNDDGLNDFLAIQFIDLYPNNKVTIINSYGEEIITIKNYDNETNFWDGKNRRGEVIPDGTYYYILQADGVAPMAGWLMMRLSKQK